MARPRKPFNRNHSYGAGGGGGGYERSNSGTFGGGNSGGAGNTGGGGPQNFTNPPPPINSNFSPTKPAGSNSQGGLCDQDQIFIIKT